MKQQNPQNISNIKTCLICKTNFTKPDNYSPVRWEQRVNCSIDCQRISSTKKVLINCETCKKEYSMHNFRLKIYEKHFCSRDCKNKDEHSLNLFLKNTKPFTKGSTAGEKNSQWKGGITPINRKIRTSLEYKIWRKSVFERDNYTCVNCGDSKGGNLEADHIIPFCKIYRENSLQTLLFNISNGRTLCKDCHRRTDTWGRNAENFQVIQNDKNKLQLQELHS